MALALPTLPKPPKPPSFPSVGQASTSQAWENLQKTAEQLKFLQEYKPQKSFPQRIGSDITTIFKGLVKAPENLYNYANTLALQQMGLPTDYTFSLSKSAPWWKQMQENELTAEDVQKGPEGVVSGLLRAVPTNRSVFQSPDWQEYMKTYNLTEEDLLEGQKKAVRSELFQIGLPVVGTVALQFPQVREKLDIPAISPIAKMIEDFWLQSLVDDTLKIFYEPGERIEEYKEHPIISPLTDISNIFPFVAAAKGAGVGGKVGAQLGKIPTVASGKKAAAAAEAATKAGTKIPTPSGVGATVGTIVGKTKGRLAQRSTLTEMMRSYELRNSIINERVLEELLVKPVYKTTKSGKVISHLEPTAVSKFVYKGVPAKNIMKVASNKTPAQAKRLELLADAVEQTNGWNIAKVSKYPKVAKAVAEIRDIVNRNTNLHIRRGTITPQQVEVAKWGPLIRQEFSGLLKDKAFLEAHSPDDLVDLVKLAYTDPVTGKLTVDPIWMPHFWKEQFARAGQKGVGAAGMYTPRSLFERSVLKTGYIKDPVFSISQAYIVIFKAHSRKKLINQVVKEFKYKGKEKGIPPGYIEFNPRAGGAKMFPKLKTGARGTVKIPQWVGNELNRLLGSPSEFDKLLQLFWDKPTGVWKTSILTLMPRWLLNNFVGSAVLNVLSGAGLNPVALMKATEHLVEAIKLSNRTGWTIDRAMRSMNIPRRFFECGIYRGEANAALNMIKGMQKAPAAQKANAFLKYSGIMPTSTGIRRFNSVIESFNRAVHYYDRMGKAGMTFDKALKSANYFLFDYGKLSYFEKAFVRRLDPFWNWHKNITYLAMTYPFKFPGRTSMLAKLSAMEEDEEEFRFIADWTRNYVKTPFTTEEGTPLYFSTMGINPFADVIWGPGFLHPAIKMAIERITGTSVFTQRPFSSPYTQIVGGVEQPAVPSLPRHIAMQFPQFTIAEEFLRPYAKYDTGAPILSRETGKPLYPYPRWTAPLRFFGINLIPLDMEEMEKQGYERAYRAWREKQAYEELRKLGEK